MEYALRRFIIARYMSCLSKVNLISLIIIIIAKFFDRNRVSKKNVIIYGAFRAPLLYYTNAAVRMIKQ